METNASYSRLKIKWVIFFFLLCACVEEIDFSVPPAQLLTVVEGSISDLPGPYTVKVSRGFAVTDAYAKPVPYRNIKMRLLDELGNGEDFIETEPGIYLTNGIMQGQVGRSYFIKMETPDGKIFQSELEKINPVGEIEKISVQYEARTQIKNFGERNADVLNILIDANGGSGEDNYVRWRFKGTYKVVTNPELHETWIPPYSPFKNPHPCSGVRVIHGPDGSGGLLKRYAECTCCECWGNHFESEPQLSDTKLVVNNQFRNVKVAEVEIDPVSFSDKYLVEVEQLSLSRKAFEFFKLVRAQKKGASNLFQPSSGEIKGNINALNSSEPIVGIFWATASKKKSMFIYKSDLPYPLPPLPLDTRVCTDYPYSSTLKPDLW